MNRIGSHLIKKCFNFLDFSHLFLTSSIDWTVKLWSLKVSHTYFFPIITLLGNRIILTFFSSTCFCGEICDTVPQAPKKLFQFFALKTSVRFPRIRNLEKSVVADPICLKGLIQYKSSARINYKYYIRI